MFALIPARGGSKGVIGKNLRLIDGEPLVARAVRLALTVTDDVIVSTDDPQIAAVARLTGATVHDRPAHLATDTATIDALVAEFDGPLLVIQPTVPEITPELLDVWLDDLPNTKAAVVMSQPIHHIVWTTGLPAPQRANRQAIMPTHYAEVGVRYYPDDWNGDYQHHPIPADVIDIDTPSDLAAVRTRLERRSMTARVRGKKGRCPYRGRRHGDASRVGLSNPH